MDACVYVSIRKMQTRRGQNKSREQIYEITRALILTQLVLHIRRLEVNGEALCSIKS